VEIYPNLKEQVGDSIPGCEIFSLLDKKLVRWSTAYCASALACRLSVSNKKQKERWSDLQARLPNFHDTRT
jgi:hypothetical protein